MESDETVMLYDVTSLFTCVPTAQVIEIIKKRLSQDHTLGERTLSLEEIGSVLELCLNATYFNEFYLQKHGCAMGSPVSPIVADLYIEEVERKNLDMYNNKFPKFPEAREQDNNHIKQALNKCGYPNWTCIKTKKGGETVRTKDT